jgi:hypothetical protein
MNEGSSRNGMSLSEEAHCGGGAPLLGPRVMKGSLWERESPFKGAQLGNLEWARLKGTLRDG